MKRIAIVGSGASGLSAIKCCLDEGLDPVCFERTDDIGGLWNYTEEVREGQACVMKSTTVNTWKEVMSFSDFPPPDHFPNFMHNSKVKMYFEMYAEKFHLKQNIRFNTEVLRIAQADDYESTGAWAVTTRDKANGGLEKTQTFDGVMLCTGHHADKRMPTYEGMENFRGRVIHSHDYKDCTGLTGQKVVVIGFGNSGADVIMDASKNASQVFISTRRGPWIVSRIDPTGLPIDFTVSTRFAGMFMGFLPWNTKNNMIEASLNNGFNHRLFGLQPKHRFLECQPCVCDGLAIKLQTGAVAVKPDVTRFTATGVEFADGSAEEDVHLVVCATGYVFGFPFVAHPALAVVDDRVPMYKHVFPPGMSHASLAVIGCVQPLGSTISLAEMQSRWVARLFKGDCRLPSAKVMVKDIDEKERTRSARYVKGPRHTLQVDWIDYMDQIATLIGCRPSFWSVLLWDRKLAFQILFGPCIPAQYRLMGPGRWDGARDTVMGVMARMLKPLQGELTQSPPKKSGGKLKSLIVVVGVAALVRWVFFARK